MLDPRFHRKQLFVDKDVQGVLLARVGVYWAFCLIIVVLLLLCWRLLTGPSQDLHVHLDYLWFHYRPILIAAFILLPILLIDTLRLSNRFAGPMVRLKRGLTELADGRTDVSPVHFRRGDYWHDFAHEFNRLVQRVQQYQSGPWFEDVRTWEPSEGDRPSAGREGLEEVDGTERPEDPCDDHSTASAASASASASTATGGALSSR